MGSRGLTPASKVLMVKVVDDEEEATARLSLAPRSRVLKLERLRHAAGGEPLPWRLVTSLLILLQICHPGNSKTIRSFPLCSAITKWN